MSAKAIIMTGGNIAMVSGLRHILAAPLKKEKNKTLIIDDKQKAESWGLVLAFTDIHVTIKEFDIQETCIAAAEKLAKVIYDPFAPDIVVINDILKTFGE